MRAASTHGTLLGLCERLLHAAVTDAESSIGELTRLFISLRRVVREPACDCCAQVTRQEESGSILDALLGHMQFFDEHAQRVRHVAAILALLEQDASGDAVSGECREMIDRVRALLSTQSEWSLLLEVMEDKTLEPRDSSRAELF